MNKTTKFMVFIEGLVDDPKLRGTIKHAYRICTEAENIEEVNTNEWSFEISDLEYSYEIATKYLDLKNAIYKYKKSTGEERIEKNDIVVDATVIATFDLDTKPQRPGIKENSTKGNTTMEGYEFTLISLNLLIDGQDAGSIDIDDKDQLEELDPMLIAAIEKEMEPHMSEISTKASEHEYEDESGIDNYSDESNHDPDIYDQF